MKKLLSLFVVAASGLTVAAAESRSPCEVLKTVNARLVAEFLSADGLLLDYVGDIPTPEEIAELRPNAMGWWCPIENGSMFTGEWLPALMSEGESAKALVERCVRGLVKMSEVSDVPGFIARGTGTDGRSHHPLGSNDQTDPWFLGLCEYCRWPFAEPALRSRVLERLVFVAKALEANGWGVPCDGPFKGQDRGNLLAAKMPFWGKPRLLYTLKSLGQLTGDRHWDEVYARIKAGALDEIEAGGEVDAKTFKPCFGSCVWIYLASAQALARLVEMEESPADRERFRRGLSRYAGHVAGLMADRVKYANTVERPFKYANWRTGYAWREQKTQKDAEKVAYSGDRAVLGTRKGYERDGMANPLAAAAVCALSGEAKYRDEILATLRHYDYSTPNISEFFHAAVAAAALPPSGGNLFPNPGFEDAWTDGWPCRGCSVQAKGEHGFTLFERCEEVCHGGQASMHVKDADDGNFNHVLSVPLGREAVRASRGRILRASCWIRQVRASSPRSLGIRLVVKGRGWERSNANGPGSCGALDWSPCSVKVTVPDDAESAFLLFNCANGFHETGEAYFDDVVVSTVAADHPAARAVPAVERDEHRARYVPPPETDEELAEYRRQLIRQPPAEEDGRERPDIRGGNLMLGDSPQFYVGCWFGCSPWMKKNPLGIDHFAYNDPLSKELFEGLGYNSSQLSAAPGSMGAVVRGIPFPKAQHFQKDWPQYNWKVQVGELDTFFRGFGDMPLVVDFAFGPHGSYPGEVADAVAQRNRGWHAFVPFCPECPEGDLYYRSYFTGGLNTVLRGGANAFCYELFNESAYGCECRYNFEDFVRRMERRYVTIERANAVWGTIFDGWADLLAQNDYSQYRGVWYDWCRFLSERYAEILVKYRDFIRARDRRRNVYFTEQAAGTPPAHPTMDYRDIARVMDIVTLEGGFSYGVKAVVESKDEMGEVVASGGMRHVYNCDFFQALAGASRPIFNDEHYCVRTENGERVPSRKSDYKTSLWLEVMHGLSGDFTYQLGSRPWEERTLEQAHENVRKVSYKSSSLLNPFNVKPEDLSAFKEFREELEPYRELVLPKPRVKPATVAIFFSKPSEIFKTSLPAVKPFFPVPAYKSTRDTIMPGWYTALLHENYPLRVVFEEHLATLGGEVEAVVVPDAPYLTREALAALRRLSARVKVIAAEGAFRFDEYGRRLAPEESSFAKVVRTPEEALAELERAKVTRYARLEAADGGRPIAKSDVEICDRGARKLIVLAAMGETSERRAVLRLPFLQGDSARYRVKDVVRGTPVAPPSGADWAASELAAGVELTLPPQERVILDFERTVK